MFNRFMWEDFEDDSGKGAKADKNAPYRRVRSALHFDGVSTRADARPEARRARKPSPSC